MICKRKTMCAECPWRKNSAPGWLGAAEPWNFVSAIHSEEKMPCHSDVNYNNPNWRKSLETDKVSYCVGQLLATKKACKRPRDPEHAKAVDSVPPDDNSMNSNEFMKHHGEAPVKSWEL